eukprot:scaffold14.g1032.t1
MGVYVSGSADRKRKAEPTSEPPTPADERQSAQRLHTASADASLDAAVAELMGVGPAAFPATASDMPATQPSPDELSADELPATQPFPSAPAEIEAPTPVAEVSAPVAEASTPAPAAAAEALAPTPAPTAAAEAPAPSPAAPMPAPAEVPAPAPAPAEAPASTPAADTPAPAAAPASVCFPSDSFPSDSVPATSASLHAWLPESASDTQEEEQVELPPTVVLPSTGPWADGAQMVELGGYALDLEGPKLGEGGLGHVHRARHLASGREVAIKTGNDLDGARGVYDDFGCWSFTQEWRFYSSLRRGRALRGLCPEVYEFGFVRTPTGVAPWISMEELGADLHRLNRRGLITPANLSAYGLAALTSLEALHGQGWVHADVKPANFCTRGCTEDASGAPQVVLVDFGFVQAWHPGSGGGRWSFVGTPDFASLASLLGSVPGPRDDLESLGYTLLELALRELPWDVTTADGEGGARSSSAGWTVAHLEAMAEHREAIWETDSRIPGWVVDWVAAARRTSPAALPDYAYFRGLLERQAAEAAEEAAAAAAAATKAASEQPPAHLLCAEE